MGPCTKCLTKIPDNFYVEYVVVDLAEPEEMTRVELCLNCDRVYDNRSEMLIEFLKDDYGKFPIGQIERNMIDARKKRSLGEPWK